MIPEKSKRKNDDTGQPLSCGQIAGYLILFTTVMMVMAMGLGRVIR